MESHQPPLQVQANSTPPSGATTGRGKSYMLDEAVLVRLRSVNAEASYHSCREDPSCEADCPRPPGRVGGHQSRVAASGEAGAYRRSRTEPPLWCHAWARACDIGVLRT